ncbi:hypothetical protein CsatB_004033 [Cannabis sativa]
MAGKRKRKGGNEPVKKDVTPEPNDNAVGWRNFFNANYKALRAAEKGLTEKEATDKLKVQYKGFTDEEKSEWRSYDPNPNPAKKAVQTRGRKPKAADAKGKKVEVDEEEGAPDSEEASVYGRCSFNRLMRICKNLNLEQKDVIQNAGFGSFIREDAPYVDTRLVSWLIKHVDPTTSILDLYGRKIHLSAAMFGDVMGVDDGGDPVVTEGDSDTRYLEEILNVVEYTVSLTMLEKSLLECVEADSLFLIKFSLVVIGTVLAPKTGVDITSGYLHSLRVTRDIRHKNWATAGFRYLMNSIFRFRNKATKNVSGCTLFLQLVYLTHVEWNFGYVDRTVLPVDFWGSKQCKSAYKFVKDNGGPNSDKITLTSNPVILPNYYSDSEGRKSSDHFVSSINELKEYISNELKSQLRSFSLKFMDKGEGVGGIDRELEEDAAAETGKKAECSQAVEESPLKSPVRSKTNVVGLSDENVVDSVSTPSLSVTKSVEDEGAAHKTFDDEDFDILEVASFWNKGKALVKSKKSQSENVPLIEDDFNDKAYEQFIESGRTVVGPFKTKEAIPRNQYGFYKFIFSNTLDPGYVLAKFRKFEVDRRCMASLRPLREVEGSIIDCFSILMNKYERDSRLPDQPRVWYMPTRISQKTLGSFNVKRIAKDREWSKLFYEDNFEKCVKMFVPVLTLEGAPHWFGAEVNMKSKVVSFMDSLHTAMNEKYRVEATKEMLSTLDLLFEENRSKNVTFVDFRIDRKDRGLPQQDNDRDCGVYVMKYMDAVANEEEVVDEFHPVEARLEIAARIITDEQNEIRTKVVEDRRAAQGSSFASSSTPLRSPSKSPRDPRFSTAKSRNANMFPPSRASPRLQSTKTKISYGE